MRCGLLGAKLGHSYSPALHALCGDYDYELFEVSPDRLGDFLRVRDAAGARQAMSIHLRRAMLNLRLQEDGSGDAL